MTTSRTLIFVLTILALATCRKQSNTTGSLENFFASCFANIDTLNVGESRACSGETFKLINDRYVIYLSLDFPIQFESCYTISIDTANGKKMADLWVFDNKDANLTNICTDILMMNVAKPSRSLSAQRGELIVAYSDATDYGNERPHITVLIKKLVFIDGKTGNTIEIENELIWKVPDVGTPG